jgi:uncharacterized alkaline shock family protein YloU
VISLSERREKSMSEQTTDDGRQQQEESPLKTERGSTTISNAVVSRVAGLAAQEVEGVQLGGGTARAVGGILDSVAGSSGQTRGITVEVGEVEAAVELTMSVEYGRAIHQIAEAVRTNVVRRVESLVGLRVTEVSITVSDIFFPQQEQQEQ